MRRVTSGGREAARKPNPKADFWTRGTAAPEEAGGVVIWLADAERELKKIPFFVRGKARRNTEKFAAEKGRERDHCRDALRCQGPFRAMTRPYRRRIAS